MKKTNIPKYVHRVHLSFHNKIELYTEFEFDLGMFEKMSDAEHIRRMLADSNPQYTVLLTSTEVLNPRLSYDLSRPNDYRVF